MRTKPIKETGKFFLSYVVFSIRRDFEMPIKNAVTSGINLCCDMQNSKVKSERANNRIKVLTDKAQSLGPSFWRICFPDSSKRNEVITLMTDGLYYWCFKVTLCILVGHSECLILSYNERCGPRSSWWMFSVISAVLKCSSNRKCPGTQDKVSQVKTNGKRLQ